MVSAVRVERQVNAQLVEDADTPEQRRVQSTSRVALPLEEIPKRDHHVAREGFGCDAKSGQ